MDVHGRNEFPHDAAALACQGKHVHFAGAGGFHGAHHIGGISAGGDRHQHIAGLAEGIDLALEDLVEAIVVADGGEDGGIGIERDASQGQAFALEAAHQFGDEMLRVGGRAAIAASQNLAVVRQGAE
ncbi:hypothetical protein D9M70_518350 [compost metagenome]